MTPQEQQMIDGLIDRVRNTKLPNKDADADKRLHDGLASNPDALYILAQTVLGQTYSLSEAAKQVQALRTELDQLKSEQNRPQPQPSQQGQQSSGQNWQNQGSQGGTQSYGNAPQQSSGQGYGNVPYQPVNNPQYGQPYPPQPQYGGGYGQPYPPPGYGQPQYGYPTPVAYPAPAPGGMFGMGGGGFLQGAMTTAAGVAAGELLVHGVEGAVHDFERPRDYGGGFGGGFGGGEHETVVNNYYEEGGRRDEGSQGFGNVDYDRGHDASRENVGGADFGSAAGSAFGGGNGGGGWNDSANNLEDPGGGFEPNVNSGGSGWSGSTEHLLGQEDGGGFNAGQTYDSGFQQDQQDFATNAVDDSSGGGWNSDDNSGGGWDSSDNSSSDFSDSSSDFSSSDDNS